MVLRSLMTGPPELPHLMAAEWPDLRPGERERAVERAAQEGRIPARWLFGERADGSPAPLRASRWGRQYDLHTVSARAAREYAVTATLPVEHDYVDHVIDRCAPGRSWWWGGSQPDELRQDPRICAFCAAYERERRQILRMDPLPTGMVDLQLHLWRQKEAERECGRAGYRRRAHRSPSTPGDAGQQRPDGEHDYRWLQFHTDLAEMLLTAAAWAAPASESPVAGSEGASHAQHL